MKTILEFVDDKKQMGFGMVRRGFWIPYKLYTFEGNEHYEVASFHNFQAAARFFDTMAQLIGQKVDWEKAKEGNNE